MSINKVLQALENYDQKSIIDKDEEIQKACEAYFRHRQEKPHGKRMSVRAFVEILEQEFPKKRTPSRTAVQDWIIKREKQGISSE